MSQASIHHRVCQHDLLFDFVPDSYFEGLPLGNGELGAMLWFEEDRMVLSLDRADIWEHRADQSLEPGMDFATVLRQTREGSYDTSRRLFDKNRPLDRVWGNKLPVGRVEWQLPSTPVAFGARLYIHDAEFSATVRLERGELVVAGYLHATKNLIALEVKVSGLALPVPQPRAQCLDEPSRKIYRDAWKYPEPDYGEQGADRCTTQVYGRDEKYGVFARHQTRGGATGRCEITVVTGGTGDDLLRQAADDMERLAAIGDDELIRGHRQWWQKFWSRSQLSVPDAALERLWYTELYKLGCNARQDGHPMSIMGVWNPDWRIPPCYGDLHHNLETQMNYWPIFGSNHLELAQPLYDLLVQELPRFEESCRTFFGWDGAYLPANMDNIGQGVGFMWFPWNLQVGVGAWLAQHFWWHYLYSGDEEFLQDKAWPFMEAVGRFWLGFLEEEEDGQLHVPLSFSPEYDDVVRKGRDSAFDLALVRFLFTTIIEAAARLKMDGSVTAPYQEALAALAPLPIDETGIQVYAGKPLEVSHRHFSHLMAIHPLGILNVEGDDVDRALIDTSLSHLRQIGTGNWSGWSWAWMALIACRALRANTAHAMLRFYTDHVILRNTLQVSVDWKKTGFYTAEHGLINTLEAGTGAAAAVMEMLLQSWGEKIRLFPCMPEEWREASFETMRAEGAFLVSAAYADGVTRWARIISKAGRRCKVHNPWGEEEVTLCCLDDGREEKLSGAELEFDTATGGTYELTQAVLGEEAHRPQSESGDGHDRFAGLPRWH